MTKQKLPLDKELEEIRRQQHLQHELAIKSNDNCLNNLDITYSHDALAVHDKEISLNNSLPAKTNLTIFLQNGTRLIGKLIELADLGKNKWRIVFKDKNKHFFTYDTEIDLTTDNRMQILKEHLNRELEVLLTETKMDFPSWLENIMSKKDKENQLPYFFISDIEKYYKMKKAQFGTWRFAAQVGLYNCVKPQITKLNGITKLRVKNYEQV